MIFDLPPNKKERDLTPEEVQEMQDHIQRLDPERKRLFMDSDEDGMLISFPRGIMHPRTFLEIAREIE